MHELNDTLAFARYVLHLEWQGSAGGFSAAGMSSGLASRAGFRVPGEISAA